MQLVLDPKEMRGLVREVVEQVLGAIDWPAERIALSEEEAAKALGVGRHVLRDARLNDGDLKHHRVGKQIRYTRADLLDFLERYRGGV